MKNFGASFKNLPWHYICLILIVVLFFSFNVILTYDSGHYLTYVSIFEGKSPASSWDIVRGPVFPLIIHAFNIIFGKTNAGLLVGLFLFYLLFAFTCYNLCCEITKTYKHKKIIQNIVFVILILNPLIFGYFHVLLTEFVAITMTVLNIMIAYKWIFIKDDNKKSLILFAIYFIFSIVFCYHLKQPYILISFIPILVAAIIAIVRNHKRKNVIQRISTILISLIFLIISIVSWGNVLVAIGANHDSGRDSSTMLGKQLLLAYQISYDNDNDGKNDKLSTIDATNLIMGGFFKNPFRTIKIYLQNYCGLSSMCEITTPNGYDFTSTSNLVGLSTYENTFIGYATFREEDNISPMKENMSILASNYSVPKNKSIFAKPMNWLKIPTNLLFKVATITPLLSLVALTIFKLKYKNKKYNNLFYLNLILLITSCCHMFIGAGIGMIIDRYAIEIFVPSLLGLFGTITYIISLKQGKKDVVK